MQCILSAIVAIIIALAPVFNIPLTVVPPKAKAFAARADPRRQAFRYMTKSSALTTRCSISPARTRKI